MTEQHLSPPTVLKRFVIVQIPNSKLQKNMRQKHVFFGTSLIDLVMLHISLSNFVWWFSHYFSSPNPFPHKRGRKEKLKAEQKNPPLLRGKTRVGSSSWRDSNSSSPSAHFPEISRKSGFFFSPLLPPFSFLHP